MIKDTDLILCVQAQDGVMMDTSLLFILIDHALKVPCMRTTSAANINNIIDQDSCYLDPIVPMPSE